MSTSTRPAHHTPTPLTARTVTPDKSAARSAQTSAAVALNMSWQLLGTTVLPILGGHLLDSHFHTGHLWVIVGMAVGLVATVVVIRQAVQQLNEIMDTPKQKEQK
jgi:F0F1-type ATP synthase assembly protein I